MFNAIITLIPGYDQSKAVVKNGLLKIVETDGSLTSLGKITMGTSAASYLPFCAYAPNEKIEDFPHEVLESPILLYKLRKNSDFIYDLIESGLTRYISGFRWGYVNADTGEVTIDPVFDYADPFNVYGKIRNNGKSGIIDKSGKFIIPPIYGIIKKINDESGVAVVQHNNLKWGLLNLNGELITQPIYDLIDMFPDGTALVRLKGKYGMISKEGTITIDPTCDNYIDFDYYGGQVKYVENGRVVIYDFVISSVNKRFGVINRDGSWLVKPEYYKLCYLENNNGHKNSCAYLLASNKRGKWGVIDCKGKILMDLNHTLEEAKNQCRKCDFRLYDKIKEIQQR